MSFAQHMADTRSPAEKALQEAAMTMKCFYDEHHQLGPSFKVGDLVLLNNTNLHSTCPAQKLDDKCYGPFKITEQISLVNYRLNIPHRWHLSTHVFHVSKLCPFVANPSSFTLPPPPLDLINDHYEYEVETILDSRCTACGAIQYLVKWRNYSCEENSWEPCQNLSNASEAITDFHHSYPRTPCP